MKAGQDSIKRVLDVVGATIGLVVTAPVWLAIASAMRITAPGPLLYRGWRVGRNGTAFRMYKFRTMHVGADRMGPAITAGDDPRITPVGRVLRKTKLDELPQLINVLRGEMSLVGPRPEAPEYVALYNDRQRQVLTVRPGITGPTQIEYRHEEKMLQHADCDTQYRSDVLPRKLESDLGYVYSRSLWGDVWLLLRTAGRLVQG